MTLKKDSSLNRRQLLAAAAVTAGAAYARTAPAADTALHWDHETDVLCVGSGAAACSAAVAAVDAGARTMLVEKLPLLGGTTGKSGGVTWIPNHFILRNQGILDRKDDAMRYMARYAYPLEYDPNGPTLGLTPANRDALV